MARLRFLGVRVLEPGASHAFEPTRQRALIRAVAVAAEAARTHEEAAAARLELAVEEEERCHGKGARRIESSCRHSVGTLDHLLEDRHPALGLGGRRVVELEVHRRSILDVLPAPLRTGAKSRAPSVEATAYLPCTLRPRCVRTAASPFLRATSPACATWPRGPTAARVRAGRPRGGAQDSSLRAGRGSRSSRNQEHERS